MKFKFSNINLKVFLALIFLFLIGYLGALKKIELNGTTTTIAVLIYFGTSYLIIRWKGLSFIWILLPTLLGPVGIIILAFMPTQLKKKPESTEHS